MRWWVDMWDLRERGDSLAVMRFLTGIVFIGDLLWGGAAGVVPLLWSPAEAGGLPDVMGRPSQPWTYQLLPVAASSAYVIWGLAVSFGAMMTVGLFGRLAVLGTLLCSAQLALIHPNADRGIELVVRQMMFILVFSECTAAWSVDAWRRSPPSARSWRGDGRLVAAWPRHLLILQLIVIYWMAGIQKFATPWWPAGDFSAIYYVLENPIYARFDIDWGGALFPLTQLASVGTLLFEWFGPPLLLLAFWARFAVGREGGAPGRFVRWFNRLRFRDVFVAVGFSLHIGIEVLMDLGSFAIAMLAVYPAFFHPDEMEGMVRWVRGKVGWGA